MRASMCCLFWSWSDLISWAARIHPCYWDHPPSEIRLSLDHLVRTDKLSLCYEHHCVFYLSCTLALWISDTCLPASFPNDLIYSHLQRWQICSRDDDLIGKWLLCNICSWVIACCHFVSKATHSTQSKVHGPLAKLKDQALQLSRMKWLHFVIYVPNTCTDVEWKVVHKFDNAVFFQHSNLRCCCKIWMCKFVKSAACLQHLNYTTHHFCTLLHSVLRHHSDYPSHPWTWFLESLDVWIASH